MIIEIIEDLCKGCEYCIEICPEKIFNKSKKLNQRGYSIPEIKNSDSCTYCKRCELICPEMAINIEKEANNNADSHGR
ncbi:MAG: ferredoxin family protein [Candidatus Hodarchaeota archaeon]